MKIIKTVAIVGVLALGATAANASTISWSRFHDAFSDREWSGRTISSLIERFDRGHIIRGLREHHIRFTSTLPWVRPGSSPHDDSDDWPRSVPVPASGLLLVGGLGALALRRRKKS